MESVFPLVCEIKPFLDAVATLCEVSGVVARWQPFLQSVNTNGDNDAQNLGDIRVGGNMFPKDTMLFRNKMTLLSII